QIAYLFSIMAFPVRALGWVLAELPRAVVGWNRVSAVLDAQGGMEYGSGVLPSDRPSRLSADGISYSHEVITEDGQLMRNPTIRGVTIDVRAGSTVALVGPTG